MSYIYKLYIFIFKKCSSHICRWLNLGLMSRRCAYFRFNKIYGLMAIYRKYEIRGTASQFCAQLFMGNFSIRFFFILQIEDPDKVSSICKNSTSYTLMKLESLKKTVPKNLFQQIVTRIYLLVIF